MLVQRAKDNRLTTTLARHPFMLHHLRHFDKTANGIEQSEEKLRLGAQGNDPDSIADRMTRRGTRVETELPRVDTSQERCYELKPLS